MYATVEEVITEDIAEVVVDQTLAYILESEVQVEVS